MSLPFKSRYLITYIKGMAMGIADIVPGVSGGTIAFISGIYDRLISCIKSFDLKALGYLRSGKLGKLLKHLDIHFLLPLFLGIASGILLFSKIITDLIETHPVYVWGFFLGILSTSVYALGREIKRWSLLNIVAIALSTYFSYALTTLERTPFEMGYTFWFFSGFIAISAMILPGISGSFILLIMGAYRALFSKVNALREAVFSFDFTGVGKDVLTLLVFFGGAFCGLVVFSRLLSWLLKHQRDLVLSILTGFVAGALNKVWPWKNVLEYRTNSSGNQVPLIEENILPPNDSLSELCIVISLVLLGAILMYGLQKLSTKKEG